VVSWNEAAEMNESVESDALVMPSSMYSYTAGRLSVRFAFSFSSSTFRALELLARDEARLARIDDRDAGAASAARSPRCACR
jgi:hypothetical protein